MGYEVTFFRPHCMSMSEAKENALSQIRELLRQHQVVVTEYDKCTIEAYKATRIKGLTLKETSLEFIEILKRQIRLIENNYCLEAMMNRVVIDKKLTIFIKGKGLYVEVPKYLKIFRDSNPFKLYSEEQTIKYINENNIDMETYEIELLSEFWFEYPNGVIVNMP